MKTTQRNLAWRLNWYRQSELEGSLLLGRMVRAASDSYLIQQLTQHAADEARHAHIWTEAILTAQLPLIRIFRSYQSLYNEHGGTPTTLPEVLVFTQIFERRVHKRFTLESNDPTLPPAVREAFAVMITDEKNHLEWVLHWLKSVEGSEALLQKYHAIDLAVYHHILPFEDHLWDLPNLGEEISAPTPLSL